MTRRPLRNCSGRDQDGRKAALSAVVTTRTAHRPDNKGIPQWRNQTQEHHHHQGGRQMGHPTAHIYKGEIGASREPVNTGRNRSKQGSSGQSTCRMTTRPSRIAAIRAGARAHHGILQMPGHRLSDHRCGARTRKGTPCQRRTYPNGRCRNHGGLCTGPKTTAGRSRIAAAQQHRWKLWRLQHRDSA